MRIPGQVLSQSLLIFLAVSCGKSTSPPERPDVLLCVIDTLRADHLGCYGYPLDTSPNIDRLADNGVRMDDCTAQSSWTGPSMVSMMVSRHVADGFVRMPDLTTLAEILSQEGYRTAAIQANVLLKPGAGYERGFDDYVMKPDPPEFKSLITRDDGRPRFIYLHLTNPHDPYSPGDAFDRFPPAALPDSVLTGFRTELEQRNPEWPKGRVRAEAERSAALAARERALYDGEVRMADTVLQAALDLLPRPDNTIVVVASDHGECLWEHHEAPSVLAQKKIDGPLDVFKKTHNTILTEELIRVPLVFSGPEIPAGVVLESLVENVDIVPTLLDLVDISIPPGIDGQSLLPAFYAAAEGHAIPGRDVVFSNTTIFSSVRSKSGLKLVRPWNLKSDDIAQYFNLSQDPGERTPLPLEGAEYEALSRLLATLRKRALLAEESEDVIDDEVRKRMQELGYIGR